MSASPQPIRDELRQLTRLAIPLAAAHFGQMLMGAVDTAVVGRAGEIALGAAGLGNAVYFTFGTLGVGIMLGLDPLVSQAMGADEPQRARRFMWQGVWLGLALAVPITALVLAVVGGLETFGIEAASATQTQTYVLSRILSLAPFFVFAGLRSYLQALGRTSPMVWGVVIANVINLPLSWALVFGDAGLQRVGLPAVGLPALGVAGAGWTSTVCTVVQLAVVVLAVRGVPAPSDESRRRPDAALLRRTVRLGAPIGAQLCFEVGVFALVNVLMGQFGSRALAAHQIAITIASATFMIPLGIGAASSVRVGQAVGRQDQAGTRRAGLVGIGLGVAFMSITATLFFLAPRLLARIFTDDPAVASAAVPLLLIAAVFQLSDGLQAVSAGALRGAGDTRPAMIANLVGHYGLGVPLAVLLAFGLGWKGPGLWWGLVFGLTIVGIWLAVRFWRLTATLVARA